MFSCVIYPCIRSIHVKAFPAVLVDGSPTIQAHVIFQRINISRWAVAGVSVYQPSQISLRESSEFGCEFVYRKIILFVA